MGGSHTKSSEQKADEKSVLYKKLKTEKQKVTSKQNVLILGCEDAGKSTFLNQLKIECNAFSDDEIKSCSIALKENCLLAMQSILQNDSVQVSEERQEAKKIVLNAKVEDLQKVSVEIKELWKETTIKDAFEKRSQLHINIPSISDYCFENVERFASENYIATHEDILKSPVKPIYTNGINETVIEINTIEFTIIDVNQPSEQRKWLNIFDQEITCAVYLVSLDEYDIPVDGHQSYYRLEESIRFWNDLTTKHSFNPVSWILLLNKSDRFESKIKKTPLSIIFPNIPADKGSNYDDCIQYILDRYRSNFKGKRMTEFVTCASDTSFKISKALADTILTDLLNDIK